MDNFWSESLKQVPGLAVMAMFLIAGFFPLMKSVIKTMADGFGAVQGEIKETRDVQKETNDRLFDIVDKLTNGKDPPA